MWGIGLGRRYRQSCDASLPLPTDIEQYNHDEYSHDLKQPAAAPILIPVQSMPSPSSTAPRVAAVQNQVAIRRIPLPSLTELPSRFLNGSPNRRRPLSALVTYDGSPDMTLYGPSLTTSAKHSFNQFYPEDGANDFDALDVGYVFADAIQLPSGRYQSTVHPANLSLDNFHSPESSASSSSSSGQHKRNTSSSSSRSATFEFESIGPNEAQWRKLKLESSKASAEWSPKNLDIMTSENDLDRQMNELFDFDSAANSPEDSFSTETSTDRPIAGITMPQDERSPHKSERPILQAPNQKRPAVSAPFTKIDISVPVIETIIAGIANLPALHRLLDPWLPRLQASSPKVGGFLPQKLGP